MRFEDRFYFPCLRWKLGEYQALFRASSTVKDTIMPIIEVAEIGYDFKKRKEAKSVDEHLNPFARRVKDKWGNNFCFVDMHLIDPSKRMADGRHPAVFVFEDLRMKGVRAIPVIGIEPDPDLLLAIQETVSRDSLGLCIRIGIDAFTKTNLVSSINSLIRKFGLDYENCNLIIDLVAPNFEPINIFAQILARRIKDLPQLDRWQSFTVIGTSFPSSMGELNLGTSIVPRNEWRLYKSLVPLLQNSNLRIPSFGDYGINHPDVLLLDMRIVKPSASLRYTIDDSWLIVKGKNVRDHKFEQYRDICRRVVETKHYTGREYSIGDQYIYECAKGIAKTGNLTTWRWVGTNHHIEFVARDVARFAAASNTS